MVSKSYDGHFLTGDFKGDVPEDNDQSRIITALKIQDVLSYF